MEVMVQAENAPDLRPEKRVYMIARLFKYSNVYLYHHLYLRHEQRTKPFTISLQERPPISRLDVRETSARI